MNEKTDLINYWLKSAESDLVVAESLLEKGHFHYCLFIGHLVLEKTLKAVYINNVDLNAPYKHNLLLLAKKSNIELSEEQCTFLERVSRFNIEARYPDIKNDFIALCTKEFPENNFNKIKSLYLWLKTLIQ